MRQSGRTTEQMLSAPKNAWYIWPNQHLDYPRQLASNLARSDLRIFSAVTFGSMNVRGQRNQSIVVDHAVWEHFPEKLPKGFWDNKVYLEGNFIP